jgi:hypothetical protein
MSVFFFMTWASLPEAYNIVVSRARAIGLDSREASRIPLCLPNALDALRAATKAKRKGHAA